MAYITGKQAFLLARSLGVPGTRVEKAADIGPAVIRALASGGPHLVDVRIDPSFT